MIYRCVSTLKKTFQKYNYLIFFFRSPELNLPSWHFNFVYFCEGIRQTIVLTNLKVSFAKTCYWWTTVQFMSSLRLSVFPPLECQYIVLFKTRFTAAAPLQISVSELKLRIITSLVLINVNMLTEAQ